MAGSIKDAYETARRKTKVAKRSVNEQSQDVSTMLNEVADITRDYVREYPMRALSIAVGLGFFWGLTRHRHR